MSTDFHVRILEELYDEDGLVVLAKGMGLPALLCACVRVCCTPDELVFVLNASPSAEQLLVERMLAASVAVVPAVVTNLFSPAERGELYTRGGVLCITPRLLVVDMLAGRVPIERVTGLLVDNAHQVGDTSNISFIVRLYRQRNQTGFLRAFSDEPLALVRGMTRCEKVLRLLRVRRLSLWPRFQADVRAELDDAAATPLVVEYKLPMTPRTQAVQDALVECIGACLSELRRTHKSLDLPGAVGSRLQSAGEANADGGDGGREESVLVEHALFKSFDTIVRMQLDSIWHQVGRKTKQLVSDLAVLRKLLRHLGTYDSVTYYELMLALTALELPRTSAVHRPLWLLMDPAALALSNARDRVYTYVEGPLPAPPQRDNSPAVSAPGRGRSARGGRTGRTAGRGWGTKGRSGATAAAGAAQPPAPGTATVAAPPKAADSSAGAEPAGPSALGDGKPNPCLAVPVLEVNPKWALLQSILQDIDKERAAEKAARAAAALGQSHSQTQAGAIGSGHQGPGRAAGLGDAAAFASDATSLDPPVLIIVREAATIVQLSAVLRDGSEAYLRRRFVAHASERYGRCGRRGSTMRTRRGLEAEALWICAEAWRAEADGAEGLHAVASAAALEAAEQELLSQEIHAEVVSAARAQPDTTYSDVATVETRGHMRAGVGSACSHGGGRGSSASKRPRADGDSSISNAVPGAAAGAQPSYPPAGAGTRGASDMGPPPAKVGSGKAPVPQEPLPSCEAAAVARSRHASAATPSIPATPVPGAAPGKAQGVSPPVSSPPPPVLHGLTRSDEDVDGRASELLLCTTEEAPALLLECMPQEVILYEPELASVREVEVYAAWRHAALLSSAADVEDRDGDASAEAPADSDAALAARLGGSAADDAATTRPGNGSGPCPGTGPQGDNLSNPMPRRPVRVHLCVFEASVEEQRYLTAVRSERDAFRKLIDDRAHMVLPAEDAAAALDAEAAQALQADVLPRGALAAAGGSAHGPAPGVGPVARPRVVVDVREFRSALPIQLHRAGVDLVPVTLEVGDYVISPDICVERKSLSDLTESFKSGRLHHQVEAMCRYYREPTLLIELDPNRTFMLQHPSELQGDISPQALTSKLSLLLLHFPQLRVLWAHGSRSTVAHFVALKANRDQPDTEAAVAAGHGADLAATGGRGNGGGGGGGGGGSGGFSIVAQDILRRMPGVNAHNMRKLMKAAGSLQGLARMSEKSLAETIGKACARQLTAFLDTSPTDDATGA